MVRVTAGAIGSQLERDRLATRMGQLEQVTAALHARARRYERSGRPVPAGLRCSMRDFHRELERVRELLRRHGEEAVG